MRAVRPFNPASSNVHITIATDNDFSDIYLNNLIVSLKCCKIPINPILFGPLRMFTYPKKLGFYKVKKATPTNKKINKDNLTKNNKNNSNNICRKHL